MKKLPKSYKQLEYVETGEPEVYYLSGFKTIFEAQARTNELYNKYPYQQQAYTVLAMANPAINDYAEVTDNEGFYQWLASCGSNVILEVPEEMRERYGEYLQNTLAYYRK